MHRTVHPRIGVSNDDFTEHSAVGLLTELPQRQKLVLRDLPFFRRRDSWVASDRPNVLYRYQVGLSIFVIEQFHWRRLPAQADSTQNLAVFRLPFGTQPRTTAKSASAWQPQSKPEKTTIRPGVIQSGVVLSRLDKFFETVPFRPEPAW